MEPQRQSKRQTSKRILVANTVLLWVAIGYALWTGQTSAAIAFVGTIWSFAAAYMGIGHLDFKTAANLAIETQTPGEEINVVSTQSLEAPSGGDGDIGFVIHRPQALSGGG